MGAREEEREGVLDPGWGGGQEQLGWRISTAVCCIEPARGRACQESAQGSAASSGMGSEQIRVCCLPIAVGVGTSGVGMGGSSSKWDGEAAQSHRWA